MRATGGYKQWKLKGRRHHLACMTLNTRLCCDWLKISDDGDGNGLLVGLIKLAAAMVRESVCLVSPGLTPEQELKPS